MQTADIPARFDAQHDIAFRRCGSAIDVRLTRPHALNALTHPMARALLAGLELWAEDRGVSHVVVSADAGPKAAFCAGGDIRDLHEAAAAGNPRFAFFRDEYRLNAAIAAFPKPYVALIDGLVMGGGAGIAMHGSHRVSGDMTRFAMPEVAIGLVPDVGGSYVLPRLPGGAGWLLGLTGLVIDAAACGALGLATHHVPSASHGALRDALLQSSDPESVLAAHGEPFAASPLPELCRLLPLGADVPVEVLLSALSAKAGAHPLLASAHERAGKACPLSLMLAQELLARGARQDLRACLSTEFRVVSRILRGPNLYEGIRAAVLDRSRPAAWSPQTLAEISPAMVAAHFEASPEGDLVWEVAA